MTVPATARRAGPFNGTGAQTAFPFTFRVFSASDLAVTLADSAGVETVQTLTTHYTVSINADQDATPGGTVNMLTAPTIGQKLVVTGATPYSQTLDLPAGGSYSPRALENALDRTVFQVQQLAEETGRGLRLPATAAGANTQLPVPVAGSVIGWDDTATGLRNIDPATLASIVAFASWRTDTFSGTGSQTAYTLASDPGNANNCDVSISGVTQVAGADFTVSGTTLTFASAPPAGTNNIAVRYGQALPSGVANADDVVFSPALNYAVSSIGWAVQKANPINAAWYLTGTTTANQAIQAAVNAAVAADWAVLIPGGAEWLITSPITVTGAVQIVGMGRGVTRLLVNGCNAFDIAAGVSFVTIADMTIAHASRYTVAANTDTAISVNGSTASQCYWHTYRDLFIDGFEVGIYAGGLCSSSLRNVTAVYTHQGVDFASQCLNNSINQCQFSEQDNNATVPAVGSFGVRVGDGTINCEGLAITSTLCYGVKRGIHVRASINVNVSDCIIDMVHEFGILSISTAGAGCLNNQFAGNYIGITGSAGDTGVYLANGYAPADTQNRGTVVRDNEILAYPGAALNYGILVDGAEEERNTISGNRVQNTTVWDCRITAGSGHRVDENLWRSTNGFSATVPVKYGAQNVGAVSGPSLTYSASMTPDLSIFREFVITANNGTAFTINAPTNDSLRDERDWRVAFTIRNTSGGALGTATWNAIYKLATWTQPANGFSRTVEFRWNGTNYVEVSRTPADVPN